ncbi:hypothetical protein HII17_15655 [Thalassotalea sp. M1531]|uniref:Uncharacterized protein n=1 Tax=Thalassotalea algicola TaxID=2716224 RepID=A0A7Y0LED2_9GAMM|nr:hypothetical protein [Thalassotalea algicola]NMP32994.1 hypothetical protein [Thalassotalea algicola]
MITEIILSTMLSMAQPAAGEDSLGLDTSPNYTEVTVGEKRRGERIGEKRRGERIGEKRRGERIGEKRRGERIGEKRRGERI